LLERKLLHSSNHVLNAEQLKTGWLFPPQPRQQCPRISQT